MELRCRIDRGKPGGFLCSTKPHMTRNCNQTAICEASDRSSTVWCLLWMSGTQQHQIWCKWSFCLGNCANFFSSKVDSGFVSAFLYGIKKSHNCKFVYYTQGIRSRLFFLENMVILCLYICYCLW
jgi:hypothetical protein